MPSTSLLGNKGSLTRVTSTYAMLSMNATSIAPPTDKPMGSLCGRPLANVVFSPVCGSTREILPATPSVTYSAPSGPTVLPVAPSRPVTSREAVGTWHGAALAATNPTASIITMIAPPKWNFVTRIAGFRVSARMFCLFMIQFLFLFWPSLTPRFEESFLAVHWCTVLNLTRGYAEKFGFLTEGNEGREDPFPKLFGFWQTGVREENKRTELGFSRCKRKIRGSIQHRANSNFVFFALACKAPRCIHFTIRQTSSAM